MFKGINYLQDWKNNVQDSYQEASDGVQSL